MTQPASRVTAVRRSVTGYLVGVVCLVGITRSWPPSSSQLFALGVGALVVGTMSYRSYPSPLRLYQPKVMIALGLGALLIYSRVLLREGIPESLGERAAMVFVVSLPVILVIMGVQLMLSLKRKRGQ